ncbi:MAG: MYXO-CTERM sorting domain-containing protein [Planctomycetota bacterium]|jgi:uncharacterized protein (TIGR03382 family)
MKMTKRTRGAVIVAVAALSIAATYASLNYVLSPAVSDQGGGTAYSSSYEVTGSIGGPVIVTGEKTAVSPSYDLEANSIGLITYRDPAAPPPLNFGGDDGGCSATGRGAGPVALLLPLGMFVFLMRRRKAAGGGAALPRECA